MSRLAVSLTVTPERDTIQSSVDAITEALTHYGKANGGVGGPWLESRAEARGILSTGSRTTGAWRMMNDELDPASVADDILRHVTRESFTLEQVRTLIGLGIAQDRRNAAGVVPDDDF